MKICRKCKLEKDDSSYSPEYRNKDNLYPYCKSCKLEITKAYKLRIKNNPKSIITEQSCSTCNLLKSVSEFSINSTRKFGYSTKCKSCISINWKSNYETLKKRERPDIKEKKCAKCKKTSLISNFHKQSTQPNGYCSYCKNCENMRRKYKKHKITSNEFNLLELKQNFKCAICEISFKEINSKDIHIDHCHITNKIRGLLCLNCNWMLGQSRDNVSILKNAINYLEKQH